MTERLTQQEALRLIEWMEFNAEQQKDWVARDSARYVRTYILNSAQREEPYEIGITGKAYDPPGKRRAYTYQEQPDNVGACRLGYAATQARSAPGDAIDAGLALLQSLEERGFGVFELATPTPEDSSHE